VCATPTSPVSFLFFSSAVIDTTTTTFARLRVFSSRGLKNNIESMDNTRNPSTYGQQNIQHDLRVARIALEDCTKKDK